MENSVDWHDDCFYLTSQMLFLFEKGKFLDCSFLVGLEPNQKKLSAHKLILAMNSPVFERSFYGSIPFEDDPIIVPDLMADAFDAMIKFMYTEKVNFKSVEEACHVWAAAKKYMVFLLEELCLQYIWNNISDENALIVHNWAHLFENELLKNKTFQYVQKYADYILQQRFLRLTEDEFTKATHDSKILTVCEKNAILSRNITKGFSSRIFERSQYCSNFFTKKTLYFHWLTRPNQIKSFYLEEYPCVTFQVNRSIWIVGVELNNSEESFAYIRLLNKDRVQLTFVLDSIRDKNKSKLVYFENPVCIQPSENYSLMSGVGGSFDGIDKVTLTNGQTLTKFKSDYFSCLTLHGPGVKFIFTNISESFFSKLIFHYPYSKSTI